MHHSKITKQRTQNRLITVCFIFLFTLGPSLILLSILGCISFRQAGSVMTGTAAIVGVYIAYNRLSAYHQQRYIESINVERRQWLNTLRDSMDAYLNIATHLYINNEMVHSREEAQLENDLEKQVNYIKLLLNPLETINITLIHLMENAPTEKKMNKDPLVYSNDIVSEGSWINAIELCMQLILKAEWKIIKEETRYGQELKSKAKDCITQCTAKDIFSVEDEHIISLFIRDGSYNNHHLLEEQKLLRMKNFINNLSKINYPCECKK